jgi:hypothetical protein
MLIFDRLESREKAEKFAEYVRAELCRGARVFDNQEDSDRLDPFPFVLTPPIVLVDRRPNDEVKDDDEVKDTVKNFGGRYAGT